MKQFKGIGGVLLSVGLCDDAELAGDIFCARLTPGILIGQCNT